MIGTYPEKFVTGGINRLFINAEPFPYSGKVVSVSYYLHEANGALLFGIWRQVGVITFTLLDKVQLPTSNQGLNNQVLANPMQFQAGEYFGFHTTASPTKTFLSVCQPGSQLPACKCGYATPYHRQRLRDAQLPIGVTVTMEDMDIKEIALMANIEP